MKEFLDSCPADKVDSCQAKLDQIEGLLSAIKKKLGNTYKVVIFVTLLNIKEEDPVQCALETIVDRAEKCKTFRNDIFSPLVRTFVSRKLKAMQANNKAARYVRFELTYQ